MTSYLDPESTIRLLAGILAGSPRLPGALCRNRSPEVFDGETEADVAEAIALCQQCPSLTRCETWFLGLKPSKRPHGVVAGQVNHPSAPGRPRKKGVLMGARTPARKCARCHEHDTRANDGLCYRCRPCPGVYRDGETVFIGGIGSLSHDAALRLAHAIADALTP